MNPTRRLDLEMRGRAKAARLVRAKPLTVIRRGVSAFRRGFRLALRDASPSLVRTGRLVCILATGGVLLQAPAAGRAGIRSSPPERAWIRKLRGPNVRNRVAQLRRESGARHMPLSSSTSAGLATAWGPGEVPGHILQGNTVLGQ
jgi:hypothetical protein